MLVTPLSVLKRQIVGTTDVLTVEHCSKGHCTSVPCLIASSYHPREEESGL